MSVPTKTPPIQYPPRDHPLEVKKNNYPASLKPLSPNGATVPPSLAPDSLRNELMSPSDQAKQVINVLTLQLYEYNFCVNF